MNTSTGPVWDRPGGGNREHLWMWARARRWSRSTCLPHSLPGCGPSARYLVNKHTLCTNTCKTLIAMASCTWNYNIHLRTETFKIFILHLNSGCMLMPRKETINHWCRNDANLYENYTCVLVCEIINIYMVIQPLKASLLKCNKNIVCLCKRPSEISN